MSTNNTRRYKLFGIGAALTVVIGVAVQSLGTAEAQPLGYVQANCPDIVKQAFDTVTAQCSKAGRGKVCYGNSSLTAELLPGATNVAFNAPGDTLDVSQVKQLTLSSMDTSANTWGIAELKIKADLPDADPAQMVTLIMFGNTQLTDASADANAIALSETPGAAARQNQYATATAHAIDQQMTKIAATATKLAGLESTATAHALMPTPTGTIPAVKMTQAAATATKLAALENTATAVPLVSPAVSGAPGGPYNGLQAFYFQSTDSAPCDQAPHDGLLIQSPQGIKQRVTLNIDGTTISLGSTVYLTAQPSKFLTINTLEGSAVVTIAGKTQTAPAGTAIQVPLDANLRAAGPPVAIPNTFYAADVIRALPIQILPSKIVPAPGLSAGAVVYAGTLTVGGTITFSGNCHIPIGSLSFKGSSTPYTVVLDNQAGRLLVGTHILTKSADGSFQGAVPISANGGAVTATASLRFTDATTLTGQDTSQFTSGPYSGCTASIPVTLTLQPNPSSGAAITPAATPAS